jgi:hypothetical protein
VRIELKLDRSVPVIGTTTSLALKVQIGSEGEVLLSSRSVDEAMTDDPLVYARRLLNRY